MGEKWKWKEASIEIDVKGKSPMGKSVNAGGG
jgi:hypothetical protein